MRHTVAVEELLYTRARSDSFAARMITRARTRMFAAFMKNIAPTAVETVVDIGATSDRSYAFSNHFEALYPWKGRVTAAGIDDASFLEARYPGMRFVCADARDLPFVNGEFDIVHSSAVLEHVGSAAQQARMVAECLRVARRAVFITTPNRWFPIELHTLLPLIHWLPKPLGRAIMQRIGFGFFAQEENLNLLSQADLVRIMAHHPEWRFRFAPARLCGWTSNLVLLAYRIGVEPA